MWSWEHHLLNVIKSNWFQCKECIYDGIRRCIPLRLKIVCMSYCRQRLCQGCENLIIIDSGAWRLVWPQTLKICLKWWFDYPLYSFTSLRKKGNRCQLWKDLEQGVMGLPNVNFSLLFWGPPNAQMMGHSEPAPTIAPWRMNGKWSGNSFLLGFSCSFFSYLPTNNPQAGW